MALVDHIVVLAHLGPQVISGPPTAAYEDVLRLLEVPEEAIQALPLAHRQQRVGIAGEPAVTHSALDIRATNLAVFGINGERRGIAQEVDWPCGCRTRLHPHHDGVPDAWAAHVAGLEGIDPDHLLKHMVADIEARWRPDATPRVHCRCGEHFTAAGHLPDDALAAWERHVRAA